MGRVSISPDRIGLNDAWEHYETMRAAIVQFSEAAKESLIEGTGLYDRKLFGMNLAELDAYFKNLLDEADKQACLFLIACAEASIRVDFLDRVYRRRKDPVSRMFRATYKSSCNHDPRRIRLEEHILDTWSSEIRKAKTAIGTFKGALHFRHWLAHGRYWDPKPNWKYDPGGVVQIVEDLFRAIELSVNE